MTIRDGSLSPEQQAVVALEYSALVLLGMTTPSIVVSTASTAAANRQASDALGAAMSYAEFEQAINTAFALNGMRVRY